MKLVTLAFETTGVDAAADEIIEVGFQLLDFKESDLGVGSGANVMCCMPSERAAESMHEAVIKMHTDSGLFDDLARHCHDALAVEKQWEKVVTPHIGPHERPALVIWSMRMFPFLDRAPWDFMIRDLWQRWDFTTVGHISTVNGIGPRSPERSRVEEKLAVMREMFTVWRRIGIIGSEASNANR